MMSDSLLTLGTFSFEGLESPERIHLKAKQRIAVHHLGSGVSISDCLGEDCEVISFRGIFSGLIAAERIRSIDYLRLQGQPLRLTWGSQTLSVLIQEFELDYSSNLWVPYKISCYVVRSAGPGSEVQADLVIASPVTQVGDMVDLLQGTGADPTSVQTAALTALATLNYDIPSQDALAETQYLISSINEQLEALAAVLQGSSRSGNGLTLRETPWIADSVANSGTEAALVLARNRVISVVVTAEGINQQ